LRYEDKIFPGLSVEIIVREGEYQGRYRTRIEEVGIRILSIGVPVSQGQFIPLREGTRLEVFFSQDSSAYTFSSVIIKRIAFPIPTFIIDYPVKIDKIQRRQYVRVPIVKPFKFQIVEREGLGQEKKGFTIDMSGGGLMFKHKDKIPEKTLLILYLRIGDEDMELPAAVVRYIKETERNHYKVSVEYKDITERTRDKIIRYIFNIQRQMREKGLV